MKLGHWAQHSLGLNCDNTPIMGNRRQIFVAWLQWAVSVSVSPNTSKELMTKDTHRNISVQLKGTEPFSPKIFEESVSTRNCFLGMEADGKGRQ